MKATPVGDLELKVLRYVTEHAPVSVRDVVDGFGTPAGLARTTILTVMERLRKKSLLKRESAQGKNLYRPALEKETFLKQRIKDFFEGTLGGSASPFFAYLAETQKLSRDEIEQLKDLISELEAREKS